MSISVTTSTHARSIRRKPRIRFAGAAVEIPIEDIAMAGRLRLGQSSGLPLIIMYLERCRAEKKKAAGEKSPAASHV